MKKNLNSRNGLIHLYNPKKEGLGHYDLNYINAYKKDNINKKLLNKKNKERYAAWFHSSEVFQS